MSAPAGQIAMLQVPVWSTGFRGPVGQRLLVSEGRIDGKAADLCVTSSEIHICLRFSGDTFAVDLQALCQAAVDALDATWRPVEVRQ